MMNRENYSSTTVLETTYTTEWTMRKLGQEEARDLDTKSRNGSGIMPLCPGSANRAVGSGADGSGRIAVICRRVLRGKNDFALPPGSRMRQGRESRDDEIRASRVPQNVLSRVLPRQWIVAGSPTAATRIRATAADDTGLQGEQVEDVVTVQRCFFSS